MGAFLVLFLGGARLSYEPFTVTRPVTHYYEDPLDAVWLRTAEALGLRVVRGPHSYASTDGHGQLLLSDASGMDPDDCLAQMILHELCHSLVQGPQSFGWVDWGLCNETGRDVSREHACLRLQAALLDGFGLREVLAPTTDFRAFYDELPPDPFQERSEEERKSIVLARAAYARRERRPWRGHVMPALQATADLLTRTHLFLSALAQSSSQDCQPTPPEGAPQKSLLQAPITPPALNFAALPVHSDPTLTCGTCAWAFSPEGSPEPGTSEILRCRQADDRLVSRAARACQNHEVPFDCLGCGACCREAYDTVEVAPDEPAAALHLPLLVERSGGYDMRRSGSRCACLQGGLELDAPVPSISGGREPDDAGENVAPRSLPGGAPFTCSIYETRPQTCRDFTLGSEHCLSARRIVGLSR